MAANSKIFERLRLDETLFDVHLLDWIQPLSVHESIESYTQRYAALIKHKNPVIIGVSFGGVIAQELTKIRSVKKVILISSLQDYYELPIILRIIKQLRLYRLFPAYFIPIIENTVLKINEQKFSRRIHGYRKYLSYRNPLYLRWAIKRLLHWKGVNTNIGILHLHGTQDEVLPIKYIKNCKPILKGSHAMILSKAKEISQLITKELS